MYILNTNQELIEQPNICRYLNGHEMNCLICLKELSKLHLCVGCDKNLCLYCIIKTQPVLTTKIINNVYINHYCFYCKKHNLIDLFNNVDLNIFKDFLKSSFLLLLDKDKTINDLQSMLQIQEDETEQKYDLSLLEEY
jgi:tRNA 2-selenouridine synthase SelU